MGRRPKYIFLQRRHTDGQQAHEKMFNIANHQRNASQNHSVITSHLSERPPSKRPQIANVGEAVEKREPSCTVGGNVHWCTPCGKQHVVPQKLKI